MRAAVLAEAGRLEIRDVPVPGARPGWALVAPSTVGICGSDVHGFEGITGRRAPGQVMGHELVGRLLEPTGALAAGTPVAVNPVLGCGTCPPCADGAWNQCPDAAVLGVAQGLPGGLAERVLVPVANLVPVPTAAPEVALAEPFAVALQAVRRGSVGAGDRVLIVGAGMVGLACAVAARRAGAARVEITDTDADKVRAAARVGAVPATAEEVDVVIDAVGVDDTLALALTRARRGGRVVLVGMGAPQVRLADYTLLTRQITLIGTWCYSAPVFAEAASFVSADPEAWSWLVDSVTPLDRVHDLFERLAQGHNPRWKPLVSVAP